MISEVRFLKESFAFYSTGPRTRASHPLRYSPCGWVMATGWSGRGGEGLQEVHPHAGLDGGGEEDLAEELGVHGAAAAEGEEEAAGLDAGEGQAVQVLVGAGGGVQILALAHQGRRIADDQAVALRALPEILEDVGLDPFVPPIRQAVLRHVLVPALDQAGRGLDEHHPRGAAAQGVEAEAAGVGEEVEHGAPGGQGLDTAAVLPLVAVEARLLPAGQLGGEGEAGLGEAGLGPAARCLRGRSPLRLRARAPRRGGRGRRWLAGWRCPAGLRRGRRRPRRARPPAPPR